MNMQHMMIASVVLAATAAGASAQEEWVREAPNPPTTPGDLKNDGIVDGSDLGLLLGAFGSKDPNDDLNDDGTVDGADLGPLLGNWS